MGFLLYEIITFLVYENIKNQIDTIAKIQIL